MEQQPTRRWNSTLISTMYLSNTEKFKVTSQNSLKPTSRASRKLLIIFKCIDKKIAVEFEKLFSY